jgi:hypothetical protein
MLGEHYLYTKWPIYLLFNNMSVSEMSVGEKYFGEMSVDEMSEDEMTFCRFVAASF